MSRATIQPILEAIPAARQEEARHYGVHPYFTRRPMKFSLPETIPLPRNSDAEFFYEIFSPRQLAGLAMLKQAIEWEGQGVVRDLLLLAWSASVAKLNKTFLSAKGRAESRGGSSIFSIYRYKLASHCVELPIWETFHGRYLNILAAKQEVMKIAYYRKLRSDGASELNSAE